MPRLLPLLAALLPLAAVAQPTGVDPSRLPSLTPRVFESRGTLAVSLPDLERQPLEGFGPAPRTFELPEDRRAEERPFTADLDALPALALAPPPEPEPDARVLRRFRAEGGLGANAGRYGRLNLSGIGQAGEFFADATYDGVRGADEFVAFDRAEVRGGGRSFAPGNLRLDGFGRFDAYGPPSADRRSRGGFGARAGVSSLGAIPYGLSLSFEQGRLRDETDATTSEGRLDGRAHLGLFRDRLRLDAAGGLAGAGAFGTDLQYGAAGAALAFGRTDGARLVAGARALAYESPAAGANERVAVAPVLDLGLPIGATTRLFASNDPHLGVRSLLDLTDENPYVAADPAVLPDLVPVDARLGLEIRPGAAIVRAYALAVRAPNRLVFEGAGGPFSADYLSATTVGLGGDVTVAATTGLSASAGLEVRQGEVEGGGEIPYLAPLVGRAGVQLPFAAGRGRLGFGAEGESARPTDRSAVTDAPAFGRLTLDARYDVAGPFSAVLRGVRLLGSAERWPGYPEPPFTLMLGLRLSR